LSKHTNDVLTRSGTGCFIAVPAWQQWALKRSGQVLTSRYGIHKNIYIHP